jgi:hypothetical protein
MLAINKVGEFQAEFELSQTDENVTMPDLVKTVSGAPGPKSVGSQPISRGSAWMRGGIRKTRRHFPLVVFSRVC